MRAVIEAILDDERERPELRRIVDSDGRVWTGRQLGGGVRSVAGHLGSRVSAGSRVAVQTRSAGRFWAACAGACAAGCDAILVPADAPRAVIDRVTSKLSPAAWLNDELLASLPESDPLSSNDTGGVILLSSGTTGRSRFVRRSPAAIDAVASGLVDEGLCVRGHRSLACVPLHHAYGFEHAFLGPALGGVELVHMGAFDPLRALELLRDGLDLLATVPPALRALLDCGWESSRACTVVVAGTPLPPALRRVFAATDGRCQLVDLYGATELGTIWLDRGNGGEPVAGVEVRVDPNGTGELLVRSATRADGYLDSGHSVTQAEKFPGGWFRTGDLGASAGDGKFRLTGRKKLVFDVAGLKVNPFDVEAAIDEHPAVTASIVAPIVDAAGVGRVHASVELRSESPGAIAGIDAAGLRSFLRDRLPAHAIPRQIEFVERLPRTASGKLIRGSDSAVGAQGASSPVCRRREGLESVEVRRRWTKKLFDESAEGYDWSSAAGLLWTDGWYRRRQLRAAGLAVGQSILDVGGGTGRTASIAASIVGPSGRVSIVDPSTGMAAVARRKGIAEVHIGIAESLPVPDASFDMVVMAYMLRHVEDLNQGFREAMRVLRPHGRICVLEITKPEGRLQRSLFRWVAAGILPVLSVVGSRKGAVYPMMSYWAETMEDAAAPRVVTDALSSAGFAGVRHRLELGVFSAYRGMKPGRP